MKRLIFAMICVGTIGGATLYMNRQKTLPDPSAEPMSETAPNQTIEDTQPARVATVQPTDPPVSAPPANIIPAPLTSPVLNDIKPVNPTNSTPFSRAMDILVSRQTTFQERQAAWKQLRDGGELDQALASLKQGATNNPSSAEYSMALGEAYVYKLQTIRDFHEVAILALQ